MLAVLALAGCDLGDGPPERHVATARGEATTAPAPTLTQPRPSRTELVVQAIRSCEVKRIVFAYGDNAWITYRGGNTVHIRRVDTEEIARAVRIARQRGLPADIVRWMRVRDEIFEQVMTRGWHPERGAFVQHYDTDVLDASVLLMPLVKFISPTDPRWLSTLDLMGKELVSDSLVYRYNASASPDGLAGDEGTFSICLFWYVEALARAGRLSTRRASPSRRCSRTPITSGCTRRRLARPARRSATSRRRSPTSR